MAVLPIAITIKREVPGTARIRRMIAGWPGRTTRFEIGHQTCRGPDVYSLSLLPQRRVRRSLNQPDSVARSGGANVRPVENIRSRTNDREVINNVTEPGSRVTCRG